MLILALIGAAHFLVTDRLERPGHDSSVYIRAAENLARDGSYEFNGAPVTWYPPGFPAMLAVVIRLFGDSRHEFLIRFVSLTGAAALLTWLLLLRQAMPPLPALLILLLVAASPTYFAMSTWWVMSDLAYFLLTGIALAGILRLSSGPRPALPFFWGLLAVAAAAAAVATRTIGVSFAVALLVWAALPSLWPAAATSSKPAARWAAVAGFAALLVFLYWVRWTSGFAASEDRGGHMASYSMQFQWKNPHRPDDGAAQPADYLRRIAQNFPLRASQIVAVAVPLSYVSPQWYNPLSILLIGFAALGSWRARREPWFQLATIYFAAYLGILLLWPFTETPRFLLPVAPLVFVLAWRGFHEFSLPVSATQWRNTAVVLWLVALAALLTAVLSSSEFGKQEMVYLAFWFAAAAGATAVFVARLQLPARLSTPALLSRCGAVAAALVILAGLGLQAAGAANNLRANPAERPLRHVREAAEWLQTAPGGVVMAGQFAVLHRFSGRRIVAFPVTADAARIRQAMERHHVRFLVVARPSGQSEYYQPAEHERLAALLQADSSLLQLVYESPRLWIYQTTLRP
jgi:hypothetical protein